MLFNPKFVSERARTKTCNKYFSIKKILEEIQEFFLQNIPITHLHKAIKNGLTV